MTAPLRSGGQAVRSTRRLLLLRDGPVCGRCRGQINMLLPGTHRLGPTIGHVIPLASGGTDELANLRLEHYACNVAAGARPDPPRALIAAPIPGDFSGQVPPQRLRRCAPNGARSARNEYVNDGK